MGIKIDSKTDKPAGTLSLLELEDEENEILIEYLNATKPQLKARFLAHLIGEDSLLKFFEVFANKNIKIPSRTEMTNIVKYIQIFHYCKERGFTIETYKKASHRYRKRPVSIYRILIKINKYLGGKYVINEYK